MLFPIIRRVYILSLILVLLLIATITVNTLTVLATAKTTGDNVKLVRSPAEVYSNQPVLILAYVPTGKEVELEVTVNIIAKTNSSKLLPPTPTIPAHKIKMLPIPWARGWYITQIPGLPSETWIFNLKLLLRTITVKFTITSKVTCRLIVDGKIVASDSYTVKEGKMLQHLPPFTYTFIYDVLNDPSIINETLGLGPHGWVIGDGESVRVMIIAFDERSQPKIRFEYRINDGSWITASTTDSSIMNELSSLVSDINMAISTIEQWVKQYKHDLTVSKPILTIKIAKATIPSQSAGTYVTFRTIANDADGNTMASPMGFYYVINKNSGTRILIIDPHIWLWLLKENIEQIFDTLKSNVDYKIPADVMVPLKRVENISKIVVDYGLEQFHHWEYLGKHYNIYITWPNEDAVDILDSFKPNVIILSDLSLGLEQGGFWNWDLREITVNDKSLLEHLTSYVKQSHAGIIATHATLSDEIVWFSCEEKQKIGARGHVGYNLKDVNINDEKTVAALLGIPELALWEYVRDKVAETLCDASKAYEATQPEVAAVLKGAAIIIGSTPLQVPHIPWNGVLKTTSEAEDFGWDLPKEFTIEMPTLTKTYGFKAYTEVGWQLALPRTLAYVTWDEASKARTDFTKLGSRLVSLYKNIAGSRVESTELNRYFDEALKHVLKDLYKGVNTAQIKGTLINISIPVPESDKLLKLTIDIGKDALINLLQKLPVKIIALSPKGLAGIIVHDKFWDPNGYRAVYFSFEVETAKGGIVEKLLINAVEWVKKWQYRNITELLDNIRLPKEIVSRFKDTVAKTPGREVFSNGLIVNEEGSSIIELTTQPGTLYLIIAHPTSDIVQVDITEGNAKVISIAKIHDHLSQATIKVSNSGAIKISLRAGSEAPLNPVYLTVKFEPYTATSTITTTITTTTVTEITTTSTTPTTTYTITTTQTTTTSPILTYTETTATTSTTTKTTTLKIPTTSVTQTTYTPYKPEGIDYTLLYVGLAVAIIIAGILIGLATKRR